MLNTTRRVFAATAALSVLALAACSGPADDAPAPAPTAEAGGGVAGEEEGEGDNDMGEDPLAESTGSPLGDANRFEYLDMGMEYDMALALDWAGDVGTPEGSFIEYPDGLRIDFKGVDPGSAPVSEEQGDLDPGRSLVRVTVEVSNSGPDALPIDGERTPFRVFEGENLTEVSSHVGYFGEEDDLYSADDARVVAPGSSLMVYRSYEVVPGASLEVELSPDFMGEAHTPFVFYGITAP